MPVDPSINEAQRRRWNDEFWASVWPRREQLTGTVTPVLIDRLRLQEGQKVLEVGSGAGIATLAAARAVGPSGQVVGADISAPLVEFASRRVQASDVPWASFVVADVQQEPLDGAPFDAALSQFGVMFFDDPVAAFTNVRSHLVPGSRFGFACWQPPDRNPWFSGPALGPFVSAPPPATNGRPAPGPFALASPKLVQSYLSDAGWNGIERTAHEITATVAPDAIMDDDQLRFLGVDPALLDDARRAVEDYLAPLRRDDGRYDAPLAFQIFTAQA